MYFSPFNMKLNEQGKDIILDVDGDIDENTCEMFERQIEALLEKKSAVTVNMESVYFANDTLIQKLLKKFVPSKVQFINYQDVVTDIDIEKTITKLKK